MPIDPMAKKPNSPKTVEALKHDEVTRKNIPTAKYLSLLQKAEQNPVRWLTVCTRWP